MRTRSSYCCSKNNWWGAPESTTGKHYNTAWSEDQTRARRGEELCLTTDRLQHRNILEAHYMGEATLHVRPQLLFRIRRLPRPPLSHLSGKLSREGLIPMLKLNISILPNPIFPRAIFFIRVRFCNNLKNNKYISSIYCIWWVFFSTAGLSPSFSLETANNNELFDTNHPVHVWLSGSGDTPEWTRVDISGHQRTPALVSGHQEPTYSYSRLESTIVVCIFILCIVNNITVLRLRTLVPPY